MGSRLRKMTEAEGHCWTNRHPTASRMGSHPRKMTAAKSHCWTNRQDLRTMLMVRKKGCRPKSGYWRTKRRRNWETSGSSRPRFRTGTSIRSSAPDRCRSGPPSSARSRRCRPAGVDSTPAHFRCRMPPCLHRRHSTVGSSPHSTGLDGRCRRRFPRFRPRRWGPRLSCRSSRSGRTVWRPRSRSRRRHLGG